MAGSPTSWDSDRKPDNIPMQFLIGNLAPHECPPDRAVWITYAFWRANSGLLESRFDCLLTSTMLS